MLEVMICRCRSCPAKKVYRNTDLHTRVHKQADRDGWAPAGNRQMLCRECRRGDEKKSE